MTSTGNSQRPWLSALLLVGACIAGMAYRLGPTGRDTEADITAGLPSGLGLYDDFPYFHTGPEFKLTRDDAAAIQAVAADFGEPIPLGTRLSHARALGMVPMAP